MLGSAEMREGECRTTAVEKKGKKRWKCRRELRSLLQNREKNIQYVVAVGFFLGITLVPMRASLRWREH